MGNVFYGLNRGQSDEQPFLVASGTSTQGTDIEVRLDDTKALTKSDVENALQSIMNYIRGGIKPGGALYPDL